MRLNPRAFMIKILQDKGATEKEIDEALKVLDDWGKEFNQKTRFDD